MTILITVIIVTVVISACCSFFEAILYSLRVGVLELAKTSGKHTSLARRALKMKRNISQPIAAILILNTIANTAGATIAGMYAAKVLGPQWVFVLSAGLTLGILLFAEILPKTFGAVHWRRFWPIVIWPVTVMRFSMYPLVWLTQRFAGLFTKENKMPTITEDEIKALVRIGEREGELSSTESMLVHNIIELEDKSVREIMTPRTVMHSLDEASLLKDVLKSSREKGFSRIPVYKDKAENITGYVTLREIEINSAAGRDNITVGSLRRDIIFSPGVSNNLQVLMTFLSVRAQLAIVVDEYGGVDGLVTLEDILETMLGSEILDEKDRVADWQKFARLKKEGI